MVVWKKGVLRGIQAIREEGYVENLAKFSNFHMQWVVEHVLVLAGYLQGCLKNLEKSNNSTVQNSGFQAFLGLVSSSRHANFGVFLVGEESCFDFGFAK